MKKIIKEINIRCDNQLETIYKILFKEEWIYLVYFVNGYRKRNKFCLSNSYL